MAGKKYAALPPFHLARPIENGPFEGSTVTPTRAPESRPLT